MSIFTVPNQPTVEDRHSHRPKSIKSTTRNLREDPSPHHHSTNNNNGTRKPPYPATKITHNKHQRHNTDNPPLLKQASSLNRQDSHLNRTHSRSRLKTQIEVYRGETIKVVRREESRDDVGDRNLWSLVRDRLQGQKGARKNDEKDTNKKMNELTMKLKQLSARQSRKDSSTAGNPEQQQSKRWRRIKQVHSDIQYTLTSSGKSLNAGLSKSIAFLMRQFLSYERAEWQGQQADQARLLEKVRSSEARNVKLVTFLNELKLKGVDVDSYWSRFQKQKQ